jgi:hypothetical protein
VAQVRAGDTETITTLITDGAGLPLAGASGVVAYIRRKSDGLTYDWSDGGWKAFASCTTPGGPMAEVDATNYPGQYSVEFDTEATEDVYYVTVDQSPLTTAGNVPQLGEIRAGQWADTVELIRKLLNNRQELAEGSSGNLITYDDDDVTPLLTSSVTGPAGGSVAIPATAPAKRSRGV